MRARLGTAAGGYLMFQGVLRLGVLEKSKWLQEQNGSKNGSSLVIHPPVHPNPETPRPETPRLETRNPTLNPEPQTLNPKP